MSSESRIVVDHYHHFPADKTIADQVLSRLTKVEKKMGELEDAVAAATTAGQNLTQSVDAEIQRSQDAVNKFTAQIDDLKSQILALQSGPQTPEVVAQINALRTVIETETARVNALNVNSPEVLPTE